MSNLNSSVYDYYHLIVKNKSVLRIFTESFQIYCFTFGNSPVSYTIFYINHEWLMSFHYDYLTRPDDLDSRPNDNNMVQFLKTFNDQTTIDYKLFNFKFSMIYPIICHKLILGM